MKNPIRGLLLLVVLMAVGISGAFGVESVDTSGHAGNSLTTTSASSGAVGNSVDRALATNGGVNDLSIDFLGGLSFADSSSIQGRVAGINVDVAGGASQGTYAFGTNSASDHNTYWLTLTAINAIDINARVSASNANNDLAEGITHIQDASGGAGSASVQNYFGVGMAFDNVAYVAQGYTHAQGTLVDSYTQAWPQGVSTYAATGMKATAPTNPTASINNFASTAMSVGDAYGVSFLLKGEADNTDTGATASAYATAYNSYARTSNINSVANDRSQIIASPYPTAWPGMAFTGPDTTLSMLETKTTSGSSSSILAYGGAAISSDRKSVV